MGFTLCVSAQRPAAAFVPVVPIRVQSGKKRLRSQLAEAGCVTVSVGVTDVDSAVEKTFHAIYAMADQALNDAKRSGRDLVVESVRTPAVRAVGSAARS